MQYHLIAETAVYRQSLMEVAAEAEKAGIHFFQLREKSKSAVEVFNLAKQIRPVLKRCYFIINGRLDVAMAAGADGVHLQKGNIPVRAVRDRFPDLLIGYSAHSLEEMQDAEKQGASYVFVSPIFSPLSKESPLPPLGLNCLADWVGRVHIPVFALGGMTPQRVRDVASAGCRGVAGITLFLKNGKFTSEGLIFE